MSDLEQRVLRLEIFDRLLLVVLVLVLGFVGGRAALSDERKSISALLLGEEAVAVEEPQAVEELPGGGRAHAFADGLRIFVMPDGRVLREQRDSRIIVGEPNPPRILQPFQSTGSLEDMNGFLSEAETVEAKRIRTRELEIVDAGGAVVYRITQDGVHAEPHAKLLGR